jgi:hypothetical protein
VVSDLGTVWICQMTISVSIVHHTRASRRAIHPHKIRAIVLEPNLVTRRKRGHWQELSALGLRGF